MAPIYLAVKCRSDYKVWSSLLDTDPEININGDGTTTWYFD